MSHSSISSSRYIELLKRTLIDHHNIGSVEYHPLEIVDPNWKTHFLHLFDKVLRFRNFSICKVKPVSDFNRSSGYDWPANALSMIGLNRLNNIEYCVKKVIVDEVPGDLMETGVWRGGATILMRALLADLEVKDRRVWVADSFAGLPEPNVEKYPLDKDSDLHNKRILKVTKEEVERNFERFDLLDDQVIFVQGWFKDSLPNCNVERLAVLRLDGDLYESTILALENLYPKLSSGGFVIVDDYNAFRFCRKAVDDFRSSYGIDEEILEIDREAVYWRKR